ncbi:efflux transporter outer membrane subunit [Legionella yabuuchiae]|uniref:efflux transporter outer membrane subunit n=1 Tax=Legionella yabuuchiae TaxID=376727 RepID=UPI0010548670|nr:efflux transporter outer membrane subunit [Legionella yabuuchiae]
MLKALVGLFCLFLTACMVGPNYREPRTPIAKQWGNHDKSVKEIKNKPRLEEASWWKVFHDPTLTKLINLGYHNNLSLQSAAMRVLQARAQLAQSVGELYPQQQALMGNLTYNRIGGGSLETLLPSNFWTDTAGASASWEIDFWGKYRRAILANDAAFLSSFAAYDNALVSLTSDIATTYVNIRMNEELIQITKKNIRVQAEGLKLAKARYKAGETSLLDVEQAQAELSQTQSRLPNYVSELQQNKDLLAVLIGTTPDRVDACLGNETSGIPKPPLSVAVGIPKETLAKRPDIYQARLEAIAQSESIGAIKANLFPSISLTGTFAFSANTIGGNSLSELFNWSNRTVTAGPGFNWPILNYGQITNAVRAQDAVFQESLFNYLNLVLKAQQEVQDNITKFSESNKTQKFLVTANRAAIKSTKLAMVRYKEGESDFTTVLDAERQQLSVETSLAVAQGDTPKALIALYRSLGGGWQIRKCHDIVPERVKAVMSARTNWGNLLLAQNHQPPLTNTKQLQDLYLPNW